jgi:hypothetical protein
MSGESTPRVVLPKPLIPRTIGALNIAFGSILLLCGICSGLYFLMISAMNPLANAATGTGGVGKNAVAIGADPQAQRKADRDAEIAKLLEKEKAAESEGEKDDLKKQRLELEDQAELAEMGQQSMAMFGLKDGVVKNYFLADVTTAGVLNVLMLIAGVGLVRLRAWGRKLGMWVAGLKVIRLLVVYSIFGAVVTPIMTKGVTDFFNKAIEIQERQNARRGQGGTPPPLLRQQQAQVGKSMAMMWTAYAVGFIVMGSIYPAIALWLLSSEGCRAACSTA